MLPPFAPQQAQNPPDSLQRQSFAAEAGNGENLQDLLRRIPSAAAFFARRYNLALIQPPELVPADAGHAGDIATEKDRPFR